METVVVFAVVVIAALVIFNRKTQTRDRSNTSGSAPRYFYRKKNSLLTPSEKAFFNRLTEVAGDRYHIFPQIHLTALMTSETKGKYYKLSYQRINRRSVDFVLCEKGSFKPVYAVELDDPSHDRPKRRARDEMVNKIFQDVGIPLVRFRNYRELSSEDIAKRFYEASGKSN